MVAPLTSPGALRSRVRRLVGRGLRHAGSSLPRRLELLDPRRWGRDRPVVTAVGQAPVHSYPPLVAELRHLHWTPTGDLELAGWTYLSTAPARGGRLRVWAQALGSTDSWSAQVVQRRDLEPGAFTKVGEDLSHAGWTATFATADLLRTEPPRAPDGLGSSVSELAVWVELTTDGQTHRSRLTRHYRWGSADQLPGQRLPTDRWLAGSWRDGAGLVLTLRDDGVVAEQVGLDAGEIVVTVSRLGSSAPTTVLLSPGEADPVRFGTERTRRVRLSADQLPAQASADLIWIAADGSRHRVLADGPTLRLSGAPTAGVGLSTSADGGLSLARRSRLVQADQLVLTGPAGTSGPALRVSGVLAGSWTGPLSLELRGSRDTFAAELTPTAGAFEVSIPLLRTDPWGHRGLAPLPGGYRLWLRDGVGRTELVQLSSEVVATLYTWVFTTPFSARLEHHPDGGGLWLMVLDPRPLAEIGSYARKRLRATYQKGDTVAEVEDAVYFESFVGESCACNPRAVFDEIRRRNLGLKLYWGVQDRSVPVPAGASAVTINSAQWWRVRHQARYLVTNDWLNDTFKHRAHQRVLQTWHGTAFKLLALDRPRARDDAAFWQAIQTENAKWDLLLAENAYSVEVMRRAYDYAGPVLESGYPRNDLLTSPEAAVVRERLRARLGIRADQRAVLYAPTWREDRTAVVTDLDLVELARTLGEGFVILVRGHAKTLRGNPDLQSDRVIDVTTYPEVSELFCAADVCITDYSSVMFDFTVTGKPLVFFTPDYDAYANRLRGVYFDLAESAPGPMVTTVGATAEVVADADQVREHFDGRYRAWTARFNAWDDGSASIRAADALLESGDGR